MQDRLAVFLVVFVCLTAIFSSVTFYIMSPRPAQPFMGFGVFSLQGLQGFVPSNMTITPPTPSELGKMQRFISDEETSNIDFTWTIKSTNRTGDLVFVNLQINGQSVSSGPVGAVSGSKF